MRIPGLTFIFGPIICWLLYIYSEFIVITFNNFYDKVGLFRILVCIGVYCVIAPLLEASFVEDSAEHYIDSKTMLPFKLLYEFLIFLNKALSVKI